MTNQSGSKIRAARSIAIPVALVVTFMLASSAIAQAQQAPADSLKGLASRVRLHDHIQIVDRNDGKIFEGEVLEMSETSIRLHGGGKLREYPESKIGEIRINRPKNKMRRALIGGAIGVVAGVGVAGAACGPNDSECTGQMAGVVPLLALAGAGVAILIPANKHDTVFRAPPAVVGLRMNLSPLVSGKTKGAVFSFSF